MSKPLSPESQAIVERASNSARYLFNPHLNPEDLAYLEGHVTPEEWSQLKAECEQA